MERFVNEISSEFILFSRCGGDLLTVPRLMVATLLNHSFSLRLLRRLLEREQDNASEEGEGKVYRMEITQDLRCDKLITVDPLLFLPAFNGVDHQPTVN